MLPRANQTPLSITPKKFNPIFAGAKTGTVSIDHDGSGSISIALKGTGVAVGARTLRRQVHDRQPLTHHCTGAWDSGPDVLAASVAPR